LPPVLNFPRCPGFAPCCPASRQDQPRDAKCPGFQGAVKMSTTIINLLPQVSDFKAKMHQIVCRLGLRPRPRWGSLQRFPRPPSWIKGALLLRAYRTLRHQDISAPGQFGTSTEWCRSVSRQFGTRFLLVPNCPDTSAPVPKYLETFRHHPSKIHMGYGAILFRQNRPTIMPSTVCRHLPILQL